MLFHKFNAWSAALSSTNRDLEWGQVGGREGDTVNSSSHLETPDNGQAVVFWTGLLEVFISEISFWQQYRTTLSVIKPYI